MHLCCTARLEPGKIGDGAARPLAHQVVERATGEEEEEQRCRGVEIGVFAGVQCFDEFSAVARMTPMEIGTSMLVLPTRSARQAERKKMRPE